jgi:dTDP-4-dehydrorhamnose 3,5-epimerase
MRAVTGLVFDVTVDLPPHSATGGRCMGVTLEAGDGRSLYVTSGSAHGFLVHSNHADVTYECSAPYHPVSERSLVRKSPALDIKWPLPPGMAPVLSPLDQAPPWFPAFPVP